MTFDEKELDNAINKIIVTSLFSCLSDTQQKQFYESAFNMIERCCFCDADELPEKIRKQLADALRVRLSDQFSEMCSLKWSTKTGHRVRVFSSID
ncbi:hypothetical protein, partial [Escherichia coli]|uniref:hypothetical protein n=2 Tax=Escherichia coli TaxID=562 RepID=UPI0020233FFC